MIKRIQAFLLKLMGVKVTKDEQTLYSKEAFDDMTIKKNYKIIHTKLNDQPRDMWREVFKRIDNNIPTK